MDYPTFLSTRSGRRLLGGGNHAGEDADVELKPRNVRAERRHCLASQRISFARRKAGDEIGQRWAAQPPADECVGRVDAGIDLLVGHAHDGEARGRCQIDECRAVAHAWGDS